MALFNEVTEDNLKTDQNLSALIALLILFCGIIKVPFDCTYMFACKDVSLKCQISGKVFRPDALKRSHLLRGKFPCMSKLL